MKKVIIYLLCLAGFQPVFGQSQMTIPSFADSIQTVKERNFYEDTLWVMDSSYFYNSIDYDLQLAGIYKVLTRDSRGNKLTGLGTGNKFSGYFENSYLDSVVYFSGTNDAHDSKTYSWNSYYQKWMDNQFQLYDEDANLIEYYNKGWNRSENQYGKGNQTIKQYENRLLVSETHNNYLPESGSWQHDEKEIIFYNESGKDSLRLKLKWSTDNDQWENEQMQKTFYNEQGKDSMWLKLNWDPSAGNWENEYRMEYFYDEAMNIVESYRDDWDGELQKWVYDGYTHFNYNENNLLDTITASIWDSKQNKLVFYKMTVFSYNTSGQLVEWVHKLFDEQLGKWINELKYVYIYEVLQNENIKYEWDTIAVNWRPVYRYISSHTADSTLFIRQYEGWDSVSQQLVPLSRLISIFDLRLNLIKRKIQMWDKSGENWLTMQQIEFFWSPFRPLQVPEFEKSKLKVYPNPAKSSVTFSYVLPPAIMQVEIEIRNAAGQTVAAESLKQVEGKAVFDTRQLPAGIYVYTLKTSHAALTGKLVVTK